MEKICVVGLGYIGLPTASLLATKGFQVHGSDVNADAVGMISRGQIHIYEPDLDVLVKAAIQSGKLKVSTKPEKADVFILAVPTPFKDQHVPDTSFVEAASKSIAPYIEAGNLIILESTSPVGTTENVAQWLMDLRPDLADKPIYVAHCPERVLPGQILKELVENDRIIGGVDKASVDRAKAFYSKFVNGEILCTNARTAELAKLTENAFRDVNIAFANELSLICDKLNINVWELIELANHHPRVNILQPGPGVGGHCIAVDPWFIVNAAPEQSRLIHQARLINDNKPYYILDKIKEKIAKFRDPVIACMGLSFKKNIDDLRESPAVLIVEEILKFYHNELLIVEPNIAKLPHKLSQKNVALVNMDTAVKQADIIVLLVDHDGFTGVDKQLLEEKVIIDTRGIWR